MAVNGVGATAASQPMNPGVAPEGGDAQKKAPKFADVWNDIQTKMGAKPTPPREIKKKLDKDDFLKIMINQMKYQDPTKPFDAEKMATEMSQITSMEQLQNMNKTLTVMTTNQTPMQRLQMTGMIGKTVTLDRNRFPHTEGQNSTVSFTLPEDAVKTKVTLMGDGGDPVFTKDLGIQDAGNISFTWDGIRTSGLPAKSGNYTIRVDAENAQGKIIATKTQSQARIIGVAFDGQDPAFIIGDARSQQKVPLGNIMKVEEESDAAASPQNTRIISSKDKIDLPEQPPAAVLAAATQQQQQQLQQKPSIRNFQEMPDKMPVVGTANAIPFGLEDRARLPEPPKEKGFPNGLGVAK